jgi:hypothetical protein
VELVELPQGLIGRITAIAVVLASVLVAPPTTEQVAKPRFISQLRAILREQKAHPRNCLRVACTILGRASVLNR